MVLPFAGFTFSADCTQHKVCNDPQQVLDAIRTYPENYQQLRNAFYPINRARPSSVIVAYFINYTNRLPQECRQGTFPWETYPSIPSNFTHLVWYTWTTTPIFSAITEYKMYEYGLYLPALSYFYLFNKSSPFFPPSQIACIKVDLAIRVPPFEALGDVTTQVGSNYPH